MVKKYQYTPLFIGIIFIFILSSIDGFQDLWSAKKVIKSITNILLVAFFSSLPAYVFYVISKKSHNINVKFNSFRLSSITIFLSLIIWSYGITRGEAPQAAGAQQMHLIFWPILIPIISLILFLGISILLFVYKWTKKLYITSRLKIDQ